MKHTREHVQLCVQVCRLVSSTSCAEEGDAELASPSALASTLLLQLHPISQLLPDCRASALLKLTLVSVAWSRAPIPTFLSPSAADRRSFVQLSSSWPYYIYVNA